MKTNVARPCLICKHPAFQHYSELVTDVTAGWYGEPRVYQDSYIHCRGCELDQGEHAFD